MSNSLDPLLALSPCPFCGDSEAPRVEAQGYGQFNVVCDASNAGCGAASGLFHKPSEAIAAWNARTKATPICRACNPTDADLQEFANEESMVAEGFTPREGFVSVHDRYPCTCGSTNRLPPPDAVKYPDSGFRTDADALAIWAAHMYDTGGTPYWGADAMHSHKHEATNYYRHLLRAANAREGGWLPIGSAPERERVLVCGGDVRSVCIAQNDPERYSPGPKDYQCWYQETSRGSGSIHPPPTHWQPLPPAPGSETQS